MLLNRSPLNLFLAYCQTVFSQTGHEKKMRKKEMWYFLSIHCVHVWNCISSVFLTWRQQHNMSNIRFFFSFFLSQHSKRASLESRSPRAKQSGLVAKESPAEIKSIPVVGLLVLSVNRCFLSLGGRGLFFCLLTGPFFSLQRRWVFTRVAS